MHSQILILSILFNAGGSGVNEISLNESTTEFVTAPIPKNDNAESKAALKEAFEIVNANFSEKGRKFSRFPIWKIIARESYNVGDRDLSRKAIALMEKAAKELNQPSKSGSLLIVASEWARHGEVAKVFEIHSKLNEYESIQTALLLESAQNAIKSGYYEAAHQMANKLPIDYFLRKESIQTVKINEICNRAIKTGITDALLKEVDQLSDESDKALAFIGGSQLNMGIDKLDPNKGSLFDIALATGNRKEAIAFVQKAEKIIEKYKEKNFYRYNLLALCRDYALLKDSQSIRRLLLLYPSAPAKDDPFPHNYNRSKLELKTMLAVAEVGEENFDAANQIANECTDKYDRACIMMYIGFALLKDGKTEKAKVSIRNARKLIFPFDMKASDLYPDLAVAYVYCGDFKTAIATVSNPYQFPVAYDSIAIAMCKVGQYEEARKVILKHIKLETWQGESLMEIAERQAKAGQIQEVKKWIAEDENQFRKAYATIGLAKGLYKEKSTVK